MKFSVLVMTFLCLFSAKLGFCELRINDPPAGAITPSGSLGFAEIFLKEGEKQWSWARNVMGCDSGSKTMVDAAVMTGGSEGISKKFPGSTVSCEGGTLKIPLGGGFVDFMFAGSKVIKTTHEYAGGGILTLHYGPGESYRFEQVLGDNKLFYSVSKKTGVINVTDGVLPALVITSNHVGKPTKQGAISLTKNELLGTWQLVADTMFNNDKKMLGSTCERAAYSLTFSSFVFSVFSQAVARDQFLAWVKTNVIYRGCSGKQFVMSEKPFSK